MTTLDLRSFVDDEHRRDQYGRMLVVPPGGTHPAGYTRVTTVAKATDDGGGLIPWKATAAIVGLLRRPGLRAQWETLLASTNGDPWYGGGKADAKKLVERCAEAGGSSDRAETGTSLHALTALVDIGRHVADLQPETERDVETYVNALIGAGVCVAVNPMTSEPFVEVSVVLDEWRVAGTADRIVHVPGFDLPMIADLKTGAELSYSWQSICVQLAAYANADAEYVQGADPNGSTDERFELPPLDRKHGLIIHLPAGEGRCDLYVVDLAAGWETFKLSMAIRSWRSRRDLAVKLPPLAARPASLGVVIAEAEAEAPAITPTLRLIESTAEERARAAHPSNERPLSEPRTAVQTEAIRSWLQARIDVIGAFSDLARADLQRSWPPMPTLKRSTEHSLLDLAAIESVLDDVEQHHSVPFGPKRPGDELIPPSAWLARLGVEFPGTTLTTNTTGDTPA